MNKNIKFVCGWIKRFPVQFILIPLSLYVSIFKDDFEKESLVASITSGELWLITIMIILGLFSYEIIRAFYVSRKSRSKMPVNQRISGMEKNIKALNASFFFSMDAFSVWIIGITLIVIAFGVGNVEFDKASFFANFHAVLIVPLASMIVYYSEYLKQQKILKLWK